MLQNLLTITIGHSLPLVALIRSVSDFKSLNFEYIAIQRQMDLPHSLLDKLFALKNILVSLVSELRGCLTHFPYYVCRDSSSYNIIIIFIGFYCANINPGKEIFICAWHWLSKIPTPSAWAEYALVRVIGMTMNSWEVLFDGIKKKNALA